MCQRWSWCGVVNSIGWGVDRGVVAEVDIDDRIKFGIDDWSDMGF